MVVVMKKSRYPPWSYGCARPSFHMDFAVPGFDNLQYSTANICGQQGAGLQKHASAICGYALPTACDCAGIPATRRFERKGVSSSRSKWAEPGQE